MRTLLRWWPLLLAALCVRAVLPLTVHAADPLVGSSWVNVTGNLANLPSGCGNMTLVSAVPGSDTVIAGVALRGLWANSSGTTWSQLGTGAGSATITNRPTRIVYDPAHPGTFWESGIYEGGGVFRTTNNGLTFQQLGSISHNDFVSIDFADPNRQTLLAGGHEQARVLWRSTNGGQSWDNIGASLPADLGFWPIPLVVDAQTHVVPLAGTSGMYRTANGGTSWQQVHPTGAFGPPTVTSNGTIYWGNGNPGSLLKSTNGGLNWTQVGSNLRVLNTPLVELPDGSLAAAGSNTVVISTDGGSTWSPVGPALPNSSSALVGLAYSPGRQAFFLSYGDCSNPWVPPDALMKLDYSSSQGPPVPLPPGNVRILSGQGPS